MNNIARIFDFPYYQLHKNDLQESLVTKYNGKWLKTSTNEYIKKANQVSRVLLKIGLNGNNKSDIQPNKTIHTPFTQTFFHGTKADLHLGDLIEVGYNSNFGKQKNAKYIFLTSTLDAAVWGAELALGKGSERIYLVEPTGEIENDPDLTDQTFPGTPSMSYRSIHPYKVVGEVTIWQGHSEEQVNAMKDALEKLKEQGINSLNDQ